MARLELDPDLLHLQAAEAMAETIVCAFERCQLEAQPLSEVQKTWLIASALLAFDGMGERCEKAAAMARDLRRIGQL